MVFSSHANKITIDKLRALKVLVYVSKAAETKEISQGLLALFNNQEYYCSTIGAFFEGDLQTLPTEPILATTMQTKILMLLKEGFSQTEVANKLCLLFTTTLPFCAIKMIAVPLPNWFVDFHSGISQKLLDIIYNQSSLD
jgi:DNA-binding NarL/FixJ family response regulator